ncbi:RAMP superfamily CRISPR-associated protein [Anthocerotibacter panamensis]|uniref:RAMP superfamily CRISPR-associated protein n=1 Tax=Anthocerotibacter panamensis TaxID=2857077 RepID=UPI001C405D27|nr:RAMP superfamily CRISPR-associated protein [Anthocerotibacter panamensis]
MTSSRLPNRQQTANEISPKPYEMVPLSREQPIRARPAGQDAFKSEGRLSGKIHLQLTVKTPVSVGSGVVMMGSDLSKETSSIPLIKTAVRRDQRLVIPGSSLKGVVRSTYEAITRSCLCKTTARGPQIPSGYQECKKNAVGVCPACQVFGAMNWQGLIQFSDALCDQTGFGRGFMPSLYRPRPKQASIYLAKGKVQGRKFYYHAVRAIDKGQQGIPVQQAQEGTTFSTSLRFMNLTPAELGTLLIVLGQDAKHPMALKIGAGKPIGMGTVVVAVTRLEHFKNLRERYSSYINSGTEILSGDAFKQAIQPMLRAAHQNLVQVTQLQALIQVLQYPTTREAPRGMY